MTVQWQPAAKWDGTEQLHLLLQLHRLSEPDTSGETSANSNTLAAQTDRALMLDDQRVLRLGLLVAGDALEGSCRLEASIYREADGLRLTTATGEETVLLGEVTIQGK